MYERTYGYRYREQDGLSTAQIAKLIRADIKTAINEGLLPERWRYSVRSERFAGGTSIDITVRDCADAWTECDGTANGGLTGCRNPWCAAGGIHKDKPGASAHDVLTDEAQAAKITLERIHGAYNHDGSDSMVDYFDVNYYGQVDFESADSARFRAREQARKAERRAALDAATDTFAIKVYGRRTQTVHTAAEIDGRVRPVCGAVLRSHSLYSRTEQPPTCSRCLAREAAA